MPIRVLIVDDHAIVRQGLRAMLEAQPEIEVIGEAADGAMAVQTARTLNPDVILMDLLMPGVGGVDAIRELRKFDMENRTLVLSSSSEDQLIKEALKAGAMGYMLKASRTAELVQAIERVAAGQTVLDPAAARVVIRQTQTQDALETLTEREREVFDLLILGRKNAEIASAITVSEATVRTHVSSVIDKLGLRDRTHIVVYALKRGLVRLEDLP
jgi:DNA-binding NarL/FixJ family response regulator